MVLMEQSQSPKLPRQHQHLTLAILVAILLVCEQVLCQNDRILNTVEMRAVNDKEIGAGSSTTRNIYSPRLTSPNQFMHFGKRLPEPVTTKLMPPARVYDLHRREQLQQPLETSSFPFLFSIELERGQTLSALPEEYERDYKFLIPHGNNLLYNSATYQHRKPLQLQQLQQYHEFPAAFEQRARMSQRAYIGPKSSRLTNANYADSNGSSDNDNDDNNNNNDNNTNDNSHLSDEQVSQIGYQSQNDDINLATRSLNQNRLVNSYSVPTKGFVSAVLFGRQNSPTFALGPYMKKAEPKENMFMHFGRK